MSAKSFTQADIARARSLLHCDLATYTSLPIGEKTLVTALRKAAGLESFVDMAKRIKKETPRDHRAAGLLAAATKRANAQALIALALAGDDETV